MELSDEDAIEEWTRAQVRVVELVEGISAEEAARPVPACPDWSVRDLLAHMVGYSTDVLADHEDDDHDDAWTQAQVDGRAGRGIAPLIAEWQGNTEPLRAWMAENGVRPLNDVTIHEQDLRGALGVPGAHDTAALALLRERFAGRVADAVADAGLPPVALEGETWRHGPADAAVVVRASDFDLARAVMARRSADQLRSWAYAELEPYLPCFETLGPLPQRSLTDGSGSAAS